MEYVHGGDVYTYEGMIDFSANINPLGPSEAVMNAAGGAVKYMGQYPDARCGKLRQALAAKLNTNHDFLVFGNGAAELIFSLVIAAKPKKALLVAPSFAEYKQALNGVDCEIVNHYLQEEEDFRLGYDYLDMLSDDIDMIFLCSPSNPVGNTIEKDLLIDIMRKCRTHNIRMVVDECFYEFLNNHRSETLQEHIEDNPHLFILRAFTKIHAMPGIRLGYAITSDLKFIDRLDSVRQPWSVSVVAQEAGLAALNESDRAEETRRFVKSQREWMEREFKRIGIKYYPPSANYVFLKSHYDLFNELKDRGILIRDCSDYDGLTTGYYRVAVRNSDENIALIKELEDIYSK